MRNIKDKHITILGAVRSGIAAAKLAKKLDAIPFVSDYSAKLNSISELDELGIEYEVGVHSEKIFNSDFIITSPGVPSNASVILEAQSKGIKIISEIEFASWFCKGNIIAITGSNGKTTTTTLCTHTLNYCGVKTYAAGNIGVAFSEVVLDVKENEYVALEVSSFQLDFIDSFKPKYSVVLNITPDHLDRYDNDFSKYANSKIKINKNQNNGDYFIYNIDDSYLSKLDITNGEKIELSLNPLLNGTFVSYGIFYFKRSEKVESVCNISELKIKGEHNQYNAMSVIAVAKLIGVENWKIAEALSSFTGVEHRLELVRTLNGIDFINDSKATNVDSVWYALRSFQNPIRLILGGKDKGNDYSRIKELVSQNVKKIYAIGSSADTISKYFKSVVEVEKIDSFEEVIKKAYREAVDGELVLLSPACASFDMFESYEERGKEFKQIVMQLIK
ncbi:MAG: UDP-N-acetylmuramoyl-L-alanine--D-glutamate ligase [Melioribacteraceae bacterium]|jgi:UDP-N-acetylmuramoylalanine--D-glutamate ligase|nr:UDP-N-acetylmuramoyl-L-alanine--D-glutamate ligase [Melioribacteraceae bacterium]